MILKSRLILGVLLFSAPCLVSPASASSLPMAIPAAVRVTAPLAPAYRASLGASRVRATARSKRIVHAQSPRRRTSRRIVWNPLLRGSHESLLRQNEEIDSEGVPRIEDDVQLREMVEREELVPIYDTRYLRLDPRLREDRRLCRPVTRDFLDDLSRAYYEQFRQKVQVNSAVRTVEQQRQLRRHNANAAPETGETASSHLAGLTVDIARRGMTRQQHAWIEQYLAGLKAKNLVEPEEERRQAVFHVMVFERYAQFRHDHERAELDDADPPRL